MEPNLGKQLSSLSEISKAQLANIFSITDLPKNLLLEPTIIKPLERICGVRWLKDNGVEKIYKLEGKVVVTNGVPQFYMIYANESIFQQAIALIRSHISSEHNVNCQYHIIMVPKVLMEFENHLEAVGLFGSIVKLHSFQWLPLALDKSLLSLEIPSMYKSLYLCNDLSFLTVYGKSLWQLSFVIGKPKFCVALGQFSNMVLKQFDMYCNELGNTDKLVSDVGGLLIFDRSIDYPSALLTPVTYTALLNEVYAVKCGTCEVPEQKSEKFDTKFNLNTNMDALSLSLHGSHDSVYNDIKHRYFSEVTTVLCSLTKQLKTEGNQAKEMALDEIKKYVTTQLQEATSKKKNISNHLQAAETIIKVLGSRYEKQRHIEANIIQNKNKSSNYKYLEEMLTTENDKWIALRFMCLMAVTQKLSDSEVTNLWNKYLLEFGYNYGYVINNLRRASFVVNSPPDTLPNKIINIPKLLGNNFYSNAAKLRQIPKDSTKIDLKSPTCSSYVFGGCYVPFIAAAASMLLNSTPIKELQNKFDMLGPLAIKDDKHYPLQNRSLIICVVGGVTYSELAACSLLEKATGSNIIVLSDKIISGNNIAQALLEDL